MSPAPTTKVCPNCGCTDLVLIDSQELKLCPDCPQECNEIRWPLDPGQQPRHGSSRQGRKDEH